MAKIEKIEGIVLSVFDYGESSRILNILTADYGVIGVIAKGSRNIKSPLCNVSQKLMHGNFYIYYKADKLSVLKEVDLLNGFFSIRNDIVKISYALFLLDLAEQVYKESSEKTVFLEIINALQKIATGFDPMVITLILKLRFLNYLGVAPVIDNCVVCGKTKGIKTLSVQKGGYLCQNCYQTGKIYQSNTIKMFRMFYYVDIAKISKINIATNVKTEINDFLEQYYRDYTGLSLRSNDFLKKICTLEE